MDIEPGSEGCGGLRSGATPEWESAMRDSPMREAPIMYAADAPRHEVGGAGQGRRPWRAQREVEWRATWTRRPRQPGRGCFRARESCESRPLACSLLPDHVKRGPIAAAMAMFERPQPEEDGMRYIERV